MKAKSNAARLRMKRMARDAGLPELAPVPKRAQQLRGDKGRFARPDEDASIPAIAARCRQAGIEMTEAVTRDMRAQWMGCQAGRAMAGEVRDEATRATLWDAIQHMRRVQVAYDRAVGAPNRHAQSLRLLLPIEALATDADAPAPDLRDDAEKSRHAVTAWTRMHGWLSYADGRSASITLRTVLDDQPCRDALAMVRALHCVADGMAGRKIVYRGA